MITRRTTTALLALVLASGSCGAPATRWMSHDGARSERTRYAGSHRDDLWATDDNGLLEHFDGATWSAVPVTAAPYVGSMVALGPEKLLFATRTALFVVTPSGIDRTLTLPVAADSLALATGFGVTLVTAGVGSMTGIFRLENDQLTPFGAPFARPLRIARIFAADDVWASTDEPAMLAPLITEQGVFPTGLAHFDGTSWRALGAGSPFAPPPLRTSSHIPASEHVVLGSHFDGARLLPLGLAEPRGGFVYWSPAGRLAQVIGFAGSTSSPNAYRPVDLGNGQTGYEQIDVTGETTLQFVSLEWTGRSWENLREIGPATQCAGVYCTGNLAGVVGELLDGTILIAAPTEEGPGMYLFTP